ncbi:MAG: hypothetical protein MSH48_03840 [Mollicutes bacterium]|nr:hypothetical protein [Mollicutes bacterium]
MRDKYLRIFFLDLSTFFGKFELNDNFINIFNNFVRTNLNDTTIDCFNKIIFVKKLKNGKYDARYSLESFIKANDDIIDDKIKGIFDGVDLKISNMIGELAVAFKEYLESVLNAFNNDDDGFYRKLKQ